MIHTGRVIFVSFVVLCFALLAQQTFGFDEKKLGKIKGKSPTKPFDQKNVKSGKKDPTLDPEDRKIPGIEIYHPENVDVGKIGAKNYSGYANRIRRDVVNETSTTGLRIGKNYKKYKLAESGTGYGYVKNKENTGKHLVKNSGKNSEKMIEDRGNSLRSRRDAVFAGKRPLRANSTDYYAQRKAVMDRFYARQREIAERYAKRTTTPRNLIVGKADPAGEKSAGSGMRENRVENEENVRNVTTTTIGPTRRVTESTTRPVEKYYVTTAKVIESNVDDGYSGSNNNVDGDDSSLDPTNSDCEDEPSTGSSSRKNRSDGRKNCEGKRGDVEQPNDEWRSESSGNGNQRWGECSGKVVYQHNLLLGLKGPSNLDAMFEVIIQGHICITCVEAIQYNKTRATVSLNSGGRGFEYVKLKLKGFENEGFSYIVKVWGVRKQGDCDDYRP